MNLRGLVTSLGAGGSLIAAALCALVLVGGILAVGGATDRTARAESGDVVVPGATAADRPATPDASVALAVAGDTAAADQPGTPARRRALRQRTSRRPAVSAPRLRPAAPWTSTPPAQADAPAESTPSAPSAPAQPEPAAEEPGTTRRVVQQARETVAPVVEAAPEPVQPVVDDVVDTVEQVAGTVDETLAPVTGLLP